MLFSLGLECQFCASCHFSSVVFHMTVKCCIAAEGEILGGE